MAEVSGDTKIYRRIKKDLRESLSAVDAYLDTGFANKSTSNVSEMMSTKSILWYFNSCLANQFF